MKIKVRIPAVTVEVDAEEWSLSYKTGLHASDIRADVQSHFDTVIRHDYTVIEGLITVVEKS